MSDLAPGLIRSLYERWQRLEADKQAISDDLKELFAEAKAQGFDGKAIRAAFRRARDLEDAERRAQLQEHDDLVDLYLQVLTRATRAYAHTREGHDPITGEIFENQGAADTAFPPPSVGHGTDESPAPTSPTASDADEIAGGYSAGAEALIDSPSRTGRRNGQVPEPGAHGAEGLGKPSHSISDEPDIPASLRRREVA